jgi:choline dehydrogenase-like flavoprotein
VVTSCQLVNVSVSDKLGQVILSAGSLATPKVLYFSGIGPNDILTRLGSAGQLSMPHNDWIVNENVGRGLYDNPNTFVMLHSPEVQSYGFGYAGTGIGVLPSDLVSYRDHRSGPYANPGQTGVFWDNVQKLKWQECCGMNLDHTYLINLDARYRFFVRICRLSMSWMLHAQHLRYGRT